MSNKGFSLVETILYVTLLSMIMLGIFSTIFSYLQSKSLSNSNFSNANYESLILNLYE